MNKKELRISMRSILKKITNREQRSKVAQEKIMNLKQYQESKKVLLYYSLDSEVSTSLLLDDAINNKQAYLPFSTNLSVGLVSSREELETVSFGIMIPKAAASEIEIARIDLVILPGLAFDRKYNRLGKGGGWYDRFLVSIPNAYKIGLCFQEQLVESIPLEKHDMKVDNVIYS